MLLEPAPTDVDAWLLAARSKLRVFPRASLGPLQTFENPRCLVRGFQADFGPSVAVVALVVFEGGALFVHAKCKPGADAEIRHVFRTLSREADLSLPGAVTPRPVALRYHALGFRFDSLQPLERPPALTLHGPDRLRIFGLASAKPIQLRRPQWSPDFALIVGTAVTETFQGREALSGRPSLSQAEPPVFRCRYWFASAELDGDERHLVYAEATAHVEHDYFRFELRGQGSSMEQLELWRAFLTSGRRS
jgi:hypothetical protein